MSGKSADAGGGGPSHRLIEIGTAVFMAAFGLVVIMGSMKAGIGWGIEGPKAGFFPFYLGLCIVAASAINLVGILAGSRGGKLFARWGQLRQVLAVVAPTAVYVALIPVLGIYVSSVLLVGVFMKWLGRYPWGLVLAVSVGVPVLAYLTFEQWFLVPLPKGPIEDWLNL